MDLPSGGSWTSFVAPLAVAQAAGELLGSTPARLTGEMCARIAIAADQQAAALLQPLRLRLGGAGEDGDAANAVLTGAANDLGGRALDDRRLHGHAADRHRRQRAAEGPPRRRPGVHPQRPAAGPRPPGQRVRARVSLQRVRGARLTRTYLIRIPPTPRGTQRLRFIGQDADQGEDGFTTIILGEEDERDEGGDPGPRDAERARRRVRSDRALRRGDAPRRPLARRGVPRRRLPISGLATTC